MKKIIDPILSTKYNLLKQKGVMRLFIDNDSNDNSNTNINFIHRLQVTENVPV